MNIEVTAVRAVLLGNTWHDVYQDSFTITPYELSSVGVVAAQGFSFKDGKGSTTVAGSLSAIAAVKYKE